MSASGISSAAKISLSCLLPADPLLPVLPTPPAWPVMTLGGNCPPPMVLSLRASAMVPSRSLSLMARSVLSYDRRKCLGNSARVLPAKSALSTAGSNFGIL